MLDGPSFAQDGALGVRRLVAVEHLVDGRIADRVRANAPAEAVELFHNAVVAVRGNQLQAAISAVVSVRFLVGVAHPAAFKSSVDYELHAAYAKPLITLVGLDGR